MQGVAHLCQLLRYTAVLNTLRVDVAAREGAEIVARELPNNRSLMHLTLGGPVPEQLLAQMSEILAANTMNAASMSPGRFQSSWSRGCRYLGCQFKSDWAPLRMVVASGP